MTEYLFMIAGQKQTAVARSKDEAIKRMQACARRTAYHAKSEVKYLGVVDKAQPALPVFRKEPLYKKINRQA